MKHILDVSEKYAALEIFDGLSDILKDSAKERPSGTVPVITYHVYVRPHRCRSVIIVDLFPVMEIPCS
jgi:hypothetical protein